MSRMKLNDYPPSARVSIAKKRQELLEWENALAKHADRIKLTEQAIAECNAKHGHLVSTTVEHPTKTGIDIVCSLESKGKITDLKYILKYLSLLVGVDKSEFDFNSTYNWVRVYKTVGDARATEFSICISVDIRKSNTCRKEKVPVEMTEQREKNMDEAIASAVEKAKNNIVNDFKFVEKVVCSESIEPNNKGELK